MIGFAINMGSANVFSDSANVFFGFCECDLWFYESARLACFKLVVYINTDSANVCFRILRMCFSDSANVFFRFCECVLRVLRMIPRVPRTGSRQQ